MDKFDDNDIQIEPDVKNEDSIPTEPIHDDQHPMSVNSDILNFFKVSEKEEKDNSLIPESPQIKDYNKNKSLSEFSIGGSLRSMK